MKTENYSLVSDLSSSAHFPAFRYHYIPGKELHKKNLGHRSPLKLLKRSLFRITN